MPTTTLPTTTLPTTTMPTTTAPAVRPRSLPQRGGRLLSALLLLAVLVSLAACGHHRRHEGDVVVDNRTDLTTSEDLLTFRLSRFGDPYSGDLLGGPLIPTAARWIGTFREDYYDGTADLSGGGIIDWQDLYVGDERTTVFEAR